MTKLSGMLAGGLVSTFIAVSAVSGGVGAKAQEYVDPWIPQPGSEQYDLIKPHEEFVKRMRNCCNLKDGRANLQERFNEGEDKETHPYIVTITHALTGVKLDQPIEIKISRDQIISVAEAKATCKPDRIANKNSTCVPPSFNVLWAYDNSNTKSLNEPFKITRVFCYYPVQNLQ